ncbi:hypothetical protein SAMN05444394_3539 [Algoriphagus halophilus]|uniref:Lipoprotein n=2 Tax=Algoriphagus halophilus TaxID=226505 RepID=A0A1N6H4E8_9BACT|nr:hypothetical protein SAMN05444394_3539 [Algoriphagus halophilus]
MGQKNLTVSILIILILSSCDPVSTLEANISNLTTENLTIEFISPDESSSKIIQMASGEMELFQEGFDIGGTYLEPSLIDYDSVVIKNQAGQILKVYKESDAGKNIYTINSYWIVDEPSRRFFKYYYEIENQDIK